MILPNKNGIKKNKALTDADIKDIVNIDENLVATSFENNRGSDIGKFDKSRSEIQNEIDKGYVEDAKGKKHPLSEDEIQVRKNMVDKMGKAQAAIDKNSNKKVINNLLDNHTIQKRIVWKMWLFLTILHLPLRPQRRVQVHRI